MRRGRGVLALAIICALATALSAQAEVSQKGNLRVTVDGELRPRKLPRTGLAPVSVSVGGRVTTTDNSLEPQLKAIRVDLNRNGRLQPAGLPICSYRRIQPASTKRALAACGSALIGNGSFTANITIAGQDPYPIKGRLLLFNGRRRGKAVLYGHIYAARPFSTSFVIVFAVRKRRQGRYGTALLARLPRAMASWGNLTGLEMTLSRRYRDHGVRRSYLSAGCPAPRGFARATFPLARTSFEFSGGRRLTSVLIGSCRVRG